MTNKIKTPKIEKNIPIPKKATGSKFKYPFREMKVGDSIVVEANAGGNYAGYWRLVTGFTFAQRRQPDGTTRIWRVS